MNAEKMWKVKKRFKAINWKSMRQLMCPEAKADNGIFNQLIRFEWSLSKAKVRNMQEMLKLELKTFIGDDNQSSSVFSVRFY